MQVIRYPSIPLLRFNRGIGGIGWTSIPSLPTPRDRKEEGYQQEGAFSLGEEEQGDERHPQPE